MTAFLFTVMGFVVFLGTTVISDMVSEEVRDRLDHLPQTILRLAARRLDPKHRAALYEEVWLPDLAYFLKGDEARPVTRLYLGIRFAIGILLSARRSGRTLDQATSKVGPRMILDTTLLWNLNVDQLESLRKLARQQGRHAWAMFLTGRARTPRSALPKQGLILLHQKKQIDQILGRLRATSEGRLRH